MLDCPECPEFHSRAFAAGLVGLCLNVFFTFPSLIGIATHFREKKSKSAVYEDKDGVATDESMAEYSTLVPKFLLSIFTTLGLLTAVALGVLATVNGEEDPMFLENWINVAQWVFFVFQTFGILVLKTTRSYTLGTYAVLSLIVYLAVILFQDALLLGNPEIDGLGPLEDTIFRYSQLVLTVLAGFTSVLFPRRPMVFKNGVPVDSMYTVSALSRYSFSWIAPLLQLAHKKKNLNLEDLPKMDHYTRSKDLSDSWAKKKHPRTLWLEVAIAHKWQFIIQWTLTLLQAFGNFAPQFVNFHLLKILEKRVSGYPVTKEAWIWVVVLTIATIGGSWIEAWLFWISWSQLAIPIRAQLAALVFEKSLRRKDVKGATKTKTDANAGPDVSEIAMGDSTAKDKPEVPEEEEADGKSKQSTVNLIGVDAKRVADFCSFNYYFPGSLFKLVVSFVFLISIIGWKALLAGFAAMSITIPVNIYFSKRYSNAQDRLMKVRDVKMAVVTEALQGIRQIKFSALETNWHEKIGKVRRKELDEQWSVYIADTFLLFCWITSPILLSATALAVYALEHGRLTPSVAFTAIGVFGNLEVTLAVIPELTTDLIDAYISIQRVAKYLMAPEITKNTFDAPSISFEKASIAWPSDEEKEDGDLRYVLRDLDIAFPENELSVISGKTGTGKSLLLAAILGEVDVLSGKISVPLSPNSLERRDHLANNDNWIIPSSIAFVAQIPWIENASIKDNILFGLPFDEQRYQKVIEVCALRKDLDMLPDGERTEIGANGINLSGGQRWRVTFARALYSRAGILVLDDIFSAVDAHVGRFIFENALTGELGVGRTRILVTHHVGLVKSKTKYVVELGDGTIENAGLVTDLEEAGTLQKILSHEEHSAEMQDDDDPTMVNSEDSSDVETGEILKKVDSKKAVKKFVEDETREQGRVKTRIYLDYMQSSGGWPFWTIAMFAFTILQGIATGRSWWLKIWTGDGDGAIAVAAIPHTLSYSLQVHAFSPFTTASNNTTIPPSDNSEHLVFYLGIYIAFSVATAVIGVFRYYWIFCGSIRASRKLFDKLSFTILRTPLRWMDTVPVGRILNRFTGDFNVVDSRLSSDIAFGAHNVFRLIGVVLAGVLVSPWVIVLSFSLFCICIYVAYLYLVGAREVKRLESNAKSPVFEQFGSALAGVGTIRAFSKTDTYIERMYNKIDDHSATFWHLWAFNRWMGWRMSLVGGLFATVVAIIIIILPNIDASLAGFALSFALDYGQTVIWTIRHYTNLELDMNAAERIIEYSNLPTESLDGADPPAHWPSEGRMEVNNLVVGYAPDLPAVLKGLSFRAERNERIGVVGRTGAGKSSLTLAIFRFLEAREGSIHIDGLDISKIKLHTLRSRLAIIPQDPVLFSGTVRTNLDAFDQHTDSELRDALERVHLVTPSALATPGEPVESSVSGTGSSNTNTNPFTSLSSPITEGGLNLSQGQRQLLCLARAIVSRPKIMVLDEATSAVDMATDTLIQRSIREEFGDSTLIVIAHRLSTIADFDKILVLDDGRSVEFGTPKSLLEIKGGVFRGMVEESGEREKLEKMILG